MYGYKNVACENGVQMVIDPHTLAGEVHKYELPSTPYFTVDDKKERVIAAEMQSMVTRKLSREAVSGDTSHFDFFHNFYKIFFSGADTADFKDRELLTNFADEHYEVLKAIPVTVRSLDGREGVEAFFEEGNIAWVGNDRVEAINGLKVEILNTIEDFGANQGMLGPEPTRQLAILRTYLKSTQ